MQIPAKRMGNDRGGSTMVIVALLLASVAMLSLTMLTTLRSSQQENQGSRESLSALYACEAGLSAAVREIALGQPGNLGTQTNPVEAGSQSFWVQATPIGAGRTSLVAFGSDDGAAMGVEAVVQPDPDSFFRWAAFGEELLHMDSNARTDSYDSAADLDADGTPDSYAEQAVNGSGSNLYANTEGDVGSNSNITMDSNIGVYGDASPGPTGTVTGDLANITGSTAPLTTGVELPDVIVPAIPLSPGTDPDHNYVVNTTTLPTGRYHFNDFQVNSNKVLTITGPATIVCEDFRLESGSHVVVDATEGPVEFFVLNDFVLNSNTQIYSTFDAPFGEPDRDYSPLDVAFNLLSDNILDPGIDVLFDEDLVDFDSGSRIYGTLFAPSAEIIIDSNFELFGSLVSRRTSLLSNARIHYDERLATVSQEAQNVFTTLCWRLVPVP